MTYRVLLSLIVLGTTACSVGPRYKVYGVDLESRASTRAFVWPADVDGDRFRYVLEEADDGARKVHTLRTDSATPPGLSAESLSGATVVLPVEATEELRLVARELLDGFALKYPGLSTHLVVTGVEWRDVRSVDGLLERVKEALDVVDPVPRGPGSMSEFMNTLSPDLIVLPRAGPDGFLIAEAQQRPFLYAMSSSTFDFAATTTKEVLDRLDKEPAYEPRRPYRWLVVLVPANADAATRRRCDQLLADIYSSSHASWAVLRRVTHIVEASQLTDVESLQGIVTEINLEAFNEGVDDPAPAQ